MTQEGCPTDILVDLSVPVNKMDALYELDDEDKENSLPLTDSIEIPRRDSLTLSQPLDFDDRILRDVTEKSVGPRAAGEPGPDVRLIDDEEFDFDLPVTPSERKGSSDVAPDEEEEVFVGPVGYMEKCIAACVAEEFIQPLSPLRPDQVAELAKEAYSVAYRISRWNVTSPEKTCAGAASLKDSLGLKVGELKPKQLSSLFRVPAQTTAEDTCVEYSTDHKNNAASSLLESAANLSGIQEFAGSTENMLQGSPDKRERSGTFTKDEPVTTLVQNIAAYGVKSGVAKTQGAVKTEGAAKPGAVARKAAPAGSKLQAPASKLTRFNNSKSNLIKESSNRPEATKTSGNKESDGRASATHGANRKSLQLPKAAGSATIERQRLNSGDSDKSLPETTSSKAASSLPKPSVRRTQSMNVKSGLPTLGSKLAVPSSRLTLKRQPAALSSLNSSSSSTDSINTSTSSIPKGPTTKPQLLQPSQLQRRSLAFGRGRGNASAQTGPLKVPAQPPPKLGDTVERPYNPEVSVGPNSQCPLTPARGEVSEPAKKLSGIATPIKSSSSLGSACGSTPGSVSRQSMSLLPTPSKRRPGASGSIPAPSPMSLASGGSSVSRRSVVSSSDAADSPVFSQTSLSKFPQNRRISGSKGSGTSSDLEGGGGSPFAFQPRKPPVQNTPDLPQKQLSKWSPVRRAKPMPLDMEVSMCTKRTTTS